MEYYDLHEWNVELNEARCIQNKLSKHLILKDSFNEISSIAGCDVAYSSTTDEAYSAICIFTYPELIKTDEISAKAKITFPYRPGFLAFREGPALLECFKKVKAKPDIILFNGQGIAHPRNMGLATHIGILLDTPSIGCARNALFGKYTLPDINKGSYSEIYNNDSNIIGLCLRTQNSIKPLYISQGYKISLKTSLEVILKCTRKYKMPEPLRAADMLANSMKNIKSI